MTAPNRIDGRDKVTGKSRYVDDLHFPGTLYGVTVRSAIARGRIKNITFGGSIPWNEVTVVTHHDLPGANIVAHILKDQQCLAGEVVNHPDEAILLLAHPDRYIAEEARKNVLVEYEPIEPVLSLEDSLAQKQVIWGKDNVIKSILIEKGDLATGFATPDVIIVEGEYRTGAQEQLYIEPNGMIAVASPDKGITVWGSMQCPYYVHHALADLFGIPGTQVRVIQTETGGGFGGKEDYPSVLACHASLLSWKSGKPVKMIYDRAEDMAATTKRHPSRTRHKTAVTRDGKIAAMDIEFLLDGGAYSTMSPVVLSRGSIHAAGPYECPNVRVVAKALATNTPPHGAFRGFGAPQSIFALERHLDEVAARIGMCPVELRRRNFLKKGSLTATGQTIREDVDLHGLLDTALRESQFEKKREEFARLTGREKKGMGLAVFMHGAGFTGSGEKNLASIAAVEATTDGRVRVLASSVEMGQGARTVFAQIAAEALALPMDRVEVAQPDTSVVPNSGPTVASRTTMVVGKLVQDASLGLRDTLMQAGLLKAGYTPDEFAQACAQHLSKTGSLKVFSQYKQPGWIQWDDQTYRGDAYGTYAWAVYVAETSVDTTTYEARVDRFTAVQEVGKVVNQVLAEGQIEGGVAQAIGYTLYENCIYRDGRLVNNRMANYIIPTSADIPPIRVVFAENPYPHGPGGAKGIGELPMDGVAPAVLNSVKAATGVSFTTIPLLPEQIMKGLKP